MYKLASRQPPGGRVQPGRTARGHDAREMSVIFLLILHGKFHNTFHEILRLGQASQMGGSCYSMEMGHAVTWTREIRRPITSHT
eukprot:3249623-Prymnesium_polylepis.1